MTQEDYNEIRDKHPSPEAQAGYLQRLHDEGSANICKCGEILEPPQVICSDCQKELK